MQHSVRTHLALKTKAKPLARLDQVLQRTVEPAALIGPVCCQFRASRCGSTYASNGVARNRHAIWKISRAAYRPGNKLFRDGAGWGTDDSDARNRPDMAHPVRLENAKQK